MDLDHLKKWHQSRPEESEPLQFSPKMYLYTIPQLILGIMGCAWCWLLLTRLPPSAIENIGGPKVYAPLILGAAWSAFWLFAYILQSWRRAIWVSVIISGWFWLRLHQQALFPALFVFAGLLILVEIYLTSRRSQR